LYSLKISLGRFPEDLNDGGLFVTGFKNVEDTSHSWLSLVLVATQITLIALIMFTGPLWPTHWGLRGLMVCGGGIGLWAFLTMGLENLRVFPEVPQHGRLVVHGPYRWVRHPMYTSVLLITLSWILGSPLSYRIMLWVGLLMILLVKLRYEESLLMERFPEYDAYRRQTKRLIPLVW
jgi:protein-S-isoprenylcysteine O-methyltransferase Ste14